LAAYSDRNVLAALLVRALLCPLLAQSGHL
jgi:hypothetical protein